MTRYLLTPTLLSSWEWFLSAQDEGSLFYSEANAEKAKADFMATLRRESFQPNDKMLAGIAFEKRVMEITQKLEPPKDYEDESYWHCVRECAEFLMGGQWQVKAEKNIEVGGRSFLLYGKIDVLKGPWIWDLKFSESFEAGKYRHSPQTLVYPEIMPGPLGIRYLVSDGKNVFIDEYRREAIPPAIGLVSQFSTWLDSFPEYGRIYFEKWESFK